MKLEIYLESQPFAGGASIYIVKLGHDGSRQLAKPMELIFEPMPEPQGQHIPASLQFSYLDSAAGFFTALAEALARAGFRQESNDTGELKATKIHLADLQKLVFEPVRMTQIVRTINETIK